MTTAMLTIGERLKKARESKSLTIDQVQKQTRIHSSVLLALEEGRCDKMLTPTYVKSFLKKYVSYLGLDAKETIELYLQEYPDARSQTEMPVKGSSKSDQRRSPNYTAIAIIAVMALVFISVVIAGFFGHRNHVKIVVAPAQKTPAPKTATVKNVRENVTEKATVKIAETRPVVPKQEPLSLSIHAKRGVLVGASADGKRLFKKHLPRGATEQVKANNIINLYLEKSESVELTLNGKKIAPARNGRIQELEITRKSIRIK